MPSVRAPRTRPFLVHAIVLREVAPQEDGAPAAAGTRLLALGTRTDHMRGGTARDATERWTRNLPIMAQPQVDALPLGLAAAADLLLVATCGPARSVWRWPPGAELEEVPPGQAAALVALVDEERELLHARTRLLRLLADHGRRDPRGVGRGARAVLARTAAREIAGTEEAAEPIAARLVAEQVGERRADVRQGASALARILGDL